MNKLIGIIIVVAVSLLFFIAISDETQAAKSSESDFSESTPIGLMEQDNTGDFYDPWTGHWQFPGENRVMLYYNDIPEGGELGDPGYEPFSVTWSLEQPTKVAPPDPDYRGENFGMIIGSRGIVMVNANPEEIIQFGEFEYRYRYFDYDTDFDDEIVCELLINSVWVYQWDTGDIAIEGFDVSAEPVNGKWLLVAYFLDGNDEYQFVSFDAISPTLTEYGRTSTPGGYPNLLISTIMSDETYGHILYYQRDDPEDYFFIFDIPETTSESWSEITSGSESGEAAWCWNIIIHVNKDLGNDQYELVASYSTDVNYEDRVGDPQSGWDDLEWLGVEFAVTDDLVWSVSTQAVWLDSYHNELKCWELHNDWEPDWWFKLKFGSATALVTTLIKLKWGYSLGPFTGGIGASILAFELCITDGAENAAEEWAQIIHWYLAKFDKVKLQMLPVCGTDWVGGPSIGYDTWNAWEESNGAYEIGEYPADNAYKDVTMYSFKDLEVAFNFAYSEKVTTSCTGAPGIESDYTYDPLTGYTIHWTFNRDIDNWAAMDEDLKPGIGDFLFAPKLDFKVKYDVDYELMSFDPGFWFPTWPFVPYDPGTITIEYGPNSDMFVAGIFDQEFTYTWNYDHSVTGAEESSDLSHTESDVTIKHVTNPDHEGSTEVRADEDELYVKYQGNVLVDLKFSFTPSPNVHEQSQVIIDDESIYINIDNFQLENIVYEHIEIDLSKTTVVLDESSAYIKINDNEVLNVNYASAGVIDIDTTEFQLDDNELSFDINGYGLIDVVYSSVGYIDIENTEIWIQPTHTIINIDGNQVIDLVYQDISEEIAYDDTSIVIRPEDIHVTINDDDVFDCNKNLGGSIDLTTTVINMDSDNYYVKLNSVEYFDYTDSQSVPVNLSNSYIAIDGSGNAVGYKNGTQVDGGTAGA